VIRCKNSSIPTRVGGRGQNKKERKKKEKLKKGNKPQKTFS
jgi:hypothetical protein